MPKNSNTKKKKLLAENLAVEPGSAVTKVAFEKDFAFVTIPSELSVCETPKDESIILSIGRDASVAEKRISGGVERTIRPIRFGDITDFDAALYFFEYVVKKRGPVSLLGMRPDVVCVVKHTISDYQRKFYRNIMGSIKAGDVYFLSNLVAADLYLDTERELGAYFLLDFGYDKSIVAVIDHTTVAYVDELNYGIADIARVIVEFFGVNSDRFIEYEDAVAIVKKNGFALKSAKLTDAVLASVGRLGSFVNFFLRKLPSVTRHDIDKLYLIGGGGLIEGIDDILKNMLEIDIVIPDAPDLVSISGARIALSDLKGHRDIFDRM